jgi:hypothetical protein
MGVDGEERHPGGAELGLQVGPGRVGTLGDCVVALVEDLVQDLEPLVGQPDLVGVGIEQQPRNLTGSVFRPDAAALHSDIPSGLLDPGQERFDPRPEA